MFVLQTYRRAVWSGHTLLAHSPAVTLKTIIGLFLFVLTLAGKGADEPTNRNDENGLWATFYKAVMNFIGLI
jgi:hypothetical protein